MAAAFVFKVIYKKHPARGKSANKKPWARSPKTAVLTFAPINAPVIGTGNTYTVSLLRENPAKLTILFGSQLQDWLGIFSAKARTDRLLSVAYYNT